MTTRTPQDQMLLRRRRFMKRHQRTCQDCGKSCHYKAKRCLKCHNKRGAWNVHNRRTKWRQQAMTGVCSDCKGPCHVRAQRCHRCACQRRGSVFCLDCGQRAAKYASGLCKSCHEAWKKEIVIAYREPGARREAWEMEP